MWKILGYLFGAMALVGVVVLGYVAFYVGGLARDLPDYEVLAKYEPSVTTRVHAGDGSLIAEFARESRIYVPANAIPARLKQAFLSAEDKNFYEHGGVDYLGIVRAAIANVDNYMNDRRLEGASTITQQVAKNFLLTSDQKLDRKVKEAILAIRIEQAFEKEKILELYLNEIYLGYSSYGVAAAALNYFDKSLDDLTLAEMAYLAAVPKAPNNYHPIRRTERAISRRNWVLSRMAANGYVSEADAEAAMELPLEVKPRRRGAKTAEVEYFVEEVRRRVYNIYGEEKLYDGGLSIRTTIDTTLQSYAVKALQDGLASYDRRHGWRGALGHIELKDDEEGNSWQQQFADFKVPADLDPWKPAIVLEANEGEAIVAFRDGTPEGIVPLSEVEWAKPWLKGQRYSSAKITSTADVLSTGDIIYVEPIFVEEAAPTPDVAEAADEDLAEIIEYQDGAKPDTVLVEETRFEEEQPAVKRVAHYALRQVPGVNGAIIAIDPHTGRVLAMSGGYSFRLSEYNRATQAERQPGSSFKPFVYAAALDQGYTPSSLVLDAPFVIDQGADQGWWKPKNYEAGAFFGPSTLRMGIEKSRNVMTVRLAQEIGMEPIVDYASRFGIRENMQPVLSMALGAGETTLFRLTTAYAELVNGGKKITPTLIDRIQDRNGSTIYRHDQRVCEACNADQWVGQPEPYLPDTRKQLIDTRTAYQIVSMLEGVVQRGTGRSIRVVGKPLGGKTGTTNDQRDAWFVGFSPDLAVGVFVGFDTPIPMGRGETGGGVAAPIFRDFMMAAIGDQPAVPFRTPEGIRLVRVNRDTGLLARRGDKAVILEAFKPGTEPSDVAPEVIGGGHISPNGQNATELEAGTGGLY